MQSRTRVGQPWWLLCLLPLLLGACGGGDDSTPGNPQPSPPPPGTVGPTGGTVAGASGGQVAIPAGALSQNVIIAITQSSSGAPALPSGHVAVGNMFAFTPHGTSFATPATITIPFDPSLVPAGETPVMLKTNATNTGWDTVSGVSITGSNASANVNGFSHILMTRLPPPVGQVGFPKRWWRFDGINAEHSLVKLEGSIPAFLAQAPWGPPEPEGPMLKTIIFGTLPFIPTGKDVNANGEIFSTDDGKTYWLEAEAPSTELMARDPNLTLLGGRAEFRMRQSYRKNLPGGTLELVITDARMELIDNNPANAATAGCPWALSQNNTLEDCEDFLMAGVDVWINVIQGFEADGVTERQPLDRLNGGATFLHSSHWGNEFDAIIDNVEGSRLFDAADNEIRRRPAWVKADFTKSRDGSKRILALNRTLNVPVDLSKVATCTAPNEPARCPEFTLDVHVTVSATNRRGGESYAFARFRDPVNVGGVGIQTTGLTETNRPILGDYMIAAQPPLPCTAGNLPAAGAVQFSATGYRVMEFGQPRPEIFVTRTGGTSGELLVRVRARNGTALAGTHYSTYERPLYFPDGDDTPKLLTLPTIDNNTNDGNVTLELVLSADPGCATLGANTVAQVTLVDDEEPPTVVTGPSGTLDTSFDLDGKMNTAPFGGTDSKMVMQPDGKFVIVGGTFTDFIAARFNNDGSPDTSFGNLGRVTLDISGGVFQERARSVAIQPDGKIVIAGEGTNGSTNNFALALIRLNADGSLDNSFSGDGKVLETNVLGRAFAVALQPDGKILAAGDIPLDAQGTGISGEMFVTRLHADGTVDTSFGIAGSRIQRMPSGTGLARNLVLLPDGGMIAAGEALTTSLLDITNVMKLDSSGALVTSFGTNGIASVDTARVGRGLAVLPDGKLLLAGGTNAYPSHFALMRLNADGSVDTSFGASGLVTTNISQSTLGEGDNALAIALRGDRIYVAGRSGSINRNFAVARYTLAGALDSSFAGTGFVAVDFTGLIDGAESIVLQGDGRIVLGGYATPTSSDGYGLVRIHP